MTCSLFFSLFLAISTRQVDIRSCVHRQRTSSESLPRAHVGLKLWGFCELILHGRVSPTDRKNPLRGASNSRSSTPATNVTSIRAEKGLTMKNVGLRLD
jgi:hypothetical protein